MAGRTSFNMPVLMATPLVEYAPFTPLVRCGCVLCALVSSCFVSHACLGGSRSWLVAGLCVACVLCLWCCPTAFALAIEGQGAHSDIHPGIYQAHMSTVVFDASDTGHTHMLPHHNQPTTTHLWQVGAALRAIGVMGEPLFRAHLPEFFPLMTALIRTEYAPPEVRVFCVMWCALHGALSVQHGCLPRSGSFILDQCASAVFWFGFSEVGSHCWTGSMDPIQQCTCAQSHP